MSSFAKFIGAASAVSKTKCNDDFSDRLNHRYTTVIIGSFVILTSLYQYTGKPVTCWAPKHFGEKWIEYANSYCWVKNTYYIPIENNIPKEEDGHLRHELKYYQWIPFILITQAVLFYAPRVIWQGFNQKGGVDCDQIMEAASKYQNAREESMRKRNLNFITQQIGRFVYFNKVGSEGGVTGRFKQCLNCFTCGICGPRLRCYLVMLYLFTKVLFLTNILFQLFILDRIFQTSYSRMGFTAIGHLAQNGTLTAQTSTFPKVTFCDFNIRRLGNLHRYTLQCVLPINLFTEKIYILLWFWFIIVFIATAVSLIQWFLRSLVGVGRVQYIQKHVRESPANETPEKHEENIRKFTNDYLQRDGSFLFRLIHHNTNSLTVNDIIDSVWKDWSKKKDDSKTPDDNLEEDDSPTKPLMNRYTQPPDSVRDSGLGFDDDPKKPNLKIDDVDSVSPSAPPIQEEGEVPHGDKGSGAQSEKLLDYMVPPTDKEPNTNTDSA